MKKKIDSEFLNNLCGIGPGFVKLGQALSTRPDIFGLNITNNEGAYKYLIESIRMFPDQDQLSSMFIKSKFERVKYRNLSKGIVSLHSGWKF